MNTLRVWIARLGGLFGRSRRDRELAEEMASHLEMQVEDNLRRGIPIDAARRAAAIKSGGVEAAKEAYRDQRGIPFVEHVVRDVRYALRVLRRSPMFTLTVVLSLGLGIGANTALFSLVDALLLRTLPVARPDELVLLRWVAHDGAMSGSIDGSINRDEGTGLVTSTSFSYTTFKRFHDDSRTLSSVFAFAPLEELDVVVDGDAQIAHGQVVSGDYYAGLGVGPFRGRTIGPADDRPDASSVAVISYAYWRRRFGEDPSMIGKHIVINNAEVTIVGVTPPGFAGTLQVGESADITLPIHADASARSNLSNTRFAWLRIMGRRAAGASAAQVKGELDGPYRESVRDATEAARNEAGAGTQPVEPPHVVADPGGQGLQELRQAYQRPLVILMGVVGLILLLACANVATLLLSRAMVREREITVRLAVGAGRARLIRQLLTESIVLALLGEGVGLLIAAAGRNTLLALRPWGNTQLDLHLALDARAFATATLIAVATGLAFGIAPALRATRLDLSGSLKTGPRHSRGRRRTRLVSGLVVAQVAMCVVLLAAAGLFIRTLHNLQTVDVGWNENSLLLFRVDPRLSGYERDRVAALYERLLERIRTVPAVRAVTFTRHPQLSNSRRTNTVLVRGHPAPVGTPRETAINNVGPAFFETMELPIVMGRGIALSDRAKSPHVAVINQSMARAYFGAESPIGGSISMHENDPEPFEIVGVAKDAHYYSVRHAVEPIVYLPYTQTDAGQANFTVRFTGDIGATTAAIRAALKDLDKNLPMFDVRTQRDAADGTMTQERLFARMSGLFGVVALLLACLGVYGVMSYSTAQRTSEIGVRIALGAQSRDISRMIMVETMTMVAGGVVIGLLAVLAATRVIAAMLFGVAASDPLTISGAIALLAAVAALAGYLPARRARRISPVAALREDG